MNILFSLLKVYTPLFMKRKKINDLMKVIAQAFQVPCPSSANKSFEDCLKEFALFTQKEAQKAINENRDLGKISKDLYRAAYKTGSDIGKMLVLKSEEDILAVTRHLYGILGIDFYGNKKGKFIIKECFFSKYYSASTCSLISALDQGLIAGLSNGNRLVFYCRITEGHHCCEGEIVYKHRGDYE